VSRDRAEVEAIVTRYGRAPLDYFYQPGLGSLVRTALALGRITWR
jgi:hypothetical protein